MSGCRLFSYLLSLAVAILVALWSLGCSRNSDAERPTLCVSILPQQAMLQELAGDRYDVVALMPSGANPENFDPAMSQLIAANRAQAYFKTGYLPFENVITEALNPEVEVFDVSTGIIPMLDSHQHAHNQHHAHNHQHAHSHDDHGGNSADISSSADPHIWTSLRNGRIMAENMTASLKQLDPAHASDYDVRLTALTQRLDSTDRRIARQLQQAGVHGFAVWHPSLSYYARDYGLHQIAVGADNKEISVSAMRDVINNIRQDSVRVFFFQQEFDSRQAHNINSEIEGSLITINPLAYDWEAELIKITNALTSHQ